MLAAAYLKTQLRSTTTNTTKRSSRGERSEEDCW